MRRAYVSIIKAYAQVGNAHPAQRWISEMSKAGLSFPREAMHELILAAEVSGGNQFVAQLVSIITKANIPLTAASLPQCDGQGAIDAKLAAKGNKRGPRQFGTKATQPKQHYAYHGGRHAMQHHNVQQRHEVQHQIGVRSMADASMEFESRLTATTRAHVDQPLASTRAPGTFSVQHHQAHPTLSELHRLMVASQAHQAEHFRNHNQNYRGLELSQAAIELHDQCYENLGDGSRPAPEAVCQSTNSGAVFGRRFSL